MLLLLAFQQLRQPNAEQAAEMATAQILLAEADLKAAEKKLKIVTADSKVADNMIFIGSIKQSVRNVIKEAVLQNEAQRDHAYTSPLDNYKPSASRPPLAVHFEKMNVNMHFIRKIRKNKPSVSVLWVQTHRKAFEDAFRTDVAYSLEVAKSDILINFLSGAETGLPNTGLGGGVIVDFSILGGLPRDVTVSDTQFTWKTVSELYGRSVEGTVGSTKVIHPSADATGFAIAPMAKKMLDQVKTAQAHHDEEMTCQYCKNGDDWPGMCEVGNQQSPIDIPQDKFLSAGSGQGVDFKFSAHKAVVLNDGTAIVAKCSMCSTGFGTYVRGTDHYVASQVVFHSPSEHTVGGKAMPLEMQVVFGLEESEDKFVTISVLFADGAENKALRKLDLHLLPGVGEPSYTTINRFNLTELITRDDGFVSYDGSSTQPPCAENNHWFVKQTLVQMSKDQIEFFRRNFAGDKKFAQGNGNNRNVKPLSGRIISLM